LPEEDGASQQQSHQDGAQFGEGEAREGGRRRRRRGRRGGRRNRQRNGEKPSFGADAAPQAEFQHAAEDIDRSPPFESEPAYTQPMDHRPASSPETAAVASDEQGVPRRRSTIREPASFSNDPSLPANNPSSTPVVSSSGADEAAAPKRGWWGKRLLGDKE